MVSPGWVGDHSTGQRTYWAGWSAAGGRPMSQLWGRRCAGSWPRQWCCLWGSPHFVQAAGERETSQHYPLKPGFITSLQRQRLVIISKQRVSKALCLAAWLLPNLLLVMLFSRESLFCFPAPHARLARYLFSPGERVLLDGPAAETDTALADGSLEQALVLWGQHLWCKIETRGFQVQTSEEPIACQTRPIASQLPHQAQGNFQLLCYLTESAVKVKR